MTNVVSRAFNQPLRGPLSEKEQLEALFQSEHLTALQLTSDPETDALTANPGYNSDTTALIRGAIVKITGPECGSGFITRDQDGNQVIVTAAHVVGTQALKDIEITDTRGNRTSAQAGRYILEDHGNLLDLGSHQTSADIDVAVLRPKADLGQTSLKIGSLARRGDWLELMNFQKDAPVDAPYHYKAIALTQWPGLKNFVLTGVEPERTDGTDESIMHTVMYHGASGGVVFDPRTRTVAGLSYFASNIILQPEDESFINVSFEKPTRATDADSRLTPMIGHILDPMYINRIINALPEA